MQNYKAQGQNLSLTAPYARSSGEGALIGSLSGVAVSDVDNAAAGVFATEGVYELEKVGSQAWTVGQKVYWDDSSKVLSNVSTVGPLVGVAVEAVGSGAGETLGKVKLLGNAPDLAEGPQASVADVATADADGTYGSPEADLLNELKAQLNAALAALRAAGIIASS